MDEASGRKLLYTSRKAVSTEPMPATLGRALETKEGQRREELHLPEGESGIQLHEPQPHPRQAEEQEQLYEVHAQNGGTAGLVCQQMAALGAQGVQLLQPAFPVLGPAAVSGRKCSSQRARRCTTGRAQRR